MVTVPSTTELLQPLEQQALRRILETTENGDSQESVFIEQYLVAKQFISQHLNI